MGVPLNKDELREVAELSGVMDGDVFDFIEPRVKREGLQLLSNPERVESKENDGLLYKNTVITRSTHQNRFSSLKKKDKLFNCILGLKPNNTACYDQTERNLFVQNIHF